MSFALERKLIEGAYKTGMPAGSPIKWENLPFTPPATGYTRLSVLSGGEGRRLEVSASDRKRTPGVIDVAIFVQPDTGTAAVRAIADQVETALAHKSLTEGFVRIVTFGATFQPIGRAGDWYQANVSIRYERDNY